MASQGPNGPGTGANAAGGVPGVAVWSNPGNITLNDGSNATATWDQSVAQGRTTQFLIASNFGFTIPTGSAINGIMVEVNRSVDNTGGSPHDLLIQLTSNASTTGLAGDDKSSGTTWPTTPAFATYGGAADTWTFLPTVAKVNASGFGVVIRTLVSSGKGTGTYSVDYVRVTITYTAGSAASVAAMTKASRGVLGSGVF